jgi:peptide-methionine (S)-S-oxide reductase
MTKIVFAGGCFWGVEAYFESLEGVLETKVGYANGDFKNPTYEMVCEKETGFAEACYIKYDSEIISLDELLKAYWIIVDPTVKDRQGHDTGTQYRTGIYYYSDDDLSIILSSRDKEQLKYDNAIVTEIEPLKNFFDAEEYHQKYLEKNPNGYCHIPRQLLKKN